MRRPPSFMPRGLARCALVLALFACAACLDRVPERGDAFDFSEVRLGDPVGAVEHAFGDRLARPQPGDEAAVAASDLELRYQMDGYRVGSFEYRVYFASDRGGRIRLIMLTRKGTAPLDAAHAELSALLRRAYGAPAQQPAALERQGVRVDQETWADPGKVVTLLSAQRTKTVNGEPVTTYSVGVAYQSASRI